MTRKKFRAIYDAIIMRARDRERAGKITGYTERHHVKPRSLGGSNDKKNIVRLTVREHVLAHWLLIKITRGEAQRKMRSALYRTTHDRGGHRIPICLIEIAKRHNAIAASMLMKKRWQDPAHRARHSAMVKELFQDPEYRARHSAMVKELYQDPEYRARHSAMMKKLHDDPVYRARHIAMSKDPERRARNSATVKEQWQDDPERRARQSAIFKKMRARERAQS